MNVRLRSSGILACTRRSLPAIGIGDHPRSDLLQSPTTTHDFCIGHGDARNHSHFRQVIVANDAILAGLVYHLASKGD